MVIPATPIKIKEKKHNWPFHVPQIFQNHLKLKQTNAKD